MNKTVSHSNTPAFVKHESNTKPVLYQQPPSDEQLAKLNKRAKAKACMQDVIAIVVLFGTIGSVPFMVQSCSEDVDHQTLQALKIQAELKEGGK